MKIQLNAATRLLASTASIPIDQAAVFFPTKVATLTSLKEGQSVKIKLGSDTHTITRKGNMLEMTK
jgi:hypothetical protein